ncbi:MAG: hypothetical protein Q8L54_15060 [Devosia sp.]|nr:hypothetical protein [Devosia sp.]
MKFIRRAALMAASSLAVLPSTGAFGGNFHGFDPSNFDGANNPRSGFMGGSYLGQAMAARFGADKVKTGYFVVDELPQPGAIPAMRAEGQGAGFRSAVAELPADHIIRFDSGNTPPAVPIPGTPDNGLALLNVSSFWQDVTRGTVLPMAVGLGQLRVRSQS